MVRPLVANASGSALGTGAVSVASGATLGGTVSGATTVASGGILAPGLAGAPGTLTLGALALNGGSVLKMDLGESASRPTK